MSPIHWPSWPSCPLQAPVRLPGRRPTAHLAAFQHQRRFLGGSQTLPWPPSTPPRPSYGDTTPPAGLPDLPTSRTIASQTCVTSVNCVTTVTNALALLALFRPVLGKRAFRPWPSCSPLAFLLGLLVWPSCSRGKPTSCGPAGS